MRIIQCTNKHFFDAERYASCPHCGAPAAEAVVPAPQKEEKKPKSGGLINILFGHGKRKNEEQVEANYASGDAMPMQQSYLQPGAGYYPGYPSPAVPQGYVMPNTASGYGSPAPAESSGVEETVALPLINPAVQIDNMGTPERNVPENPASSVPPVQPGIVSPAPIEIPPTSAMPDSAKPIEVSRETELSKAVRKAVAQNEEKTMSFFTMKVNSERTQSSPEKQETTAVEYATSVRRSSEEPVCGWLVAVSGDHFGESFELYSGKNAIGRNSNNKIILNRDKGVSREHHAFIIFEPKKRVYFLQPGDSSGLTYLNGDCITETKQLKHGDVLELGASRLLFVPLCGDDFCWETYIDGEQK